MQVTEVRAILAFGSLKLRSALVFDENIRSSRVVSLQY